MKIKRLMALALAGVMTASLLTGCGNGNNDVSEDGTVTINVWRASFNIADPDSEQVKKVETAINDYIKDKINVQIKLTDIGSAEYWEKANLALNNKEIDLLWTASWAEVIGTNLIYPKKAVYDITDLLPGTALYNSMDASQWEASKYDGRNYFVPVYKDNVEGYDLMVRKAVADQYGWDLNSIKTLADIEPMLEQCKDLKYPYLTQHVALFYRWYLDKYDFFTQTSWIAVDRSTNSVVDTVLSDDYREFCRLMAKWADAGYISEDDANKTTTDQTTQTQDWAFSYWTDLPNNDDASTRYGQDVVLVPITDRWAHSTSALGSCYAISASCSEAKAKACIDFLGLLYTDSKLADMYTFGIEGEDFTYDENGQVAQTSTKYNHDMWESASATVVTPESGQPANLIELYKAFNGGAKTSCAAGFRFDKSPVEAQYTACESLFEQYGFPLENGGVTSADVDATLDAYHDALIDAGYDKVLAEFQSQYDAWKAGN